jgi:hypothetical protein
VQVDAFTGEQTVSGSFANTYTKWALSAPTVDVRAKLVPSPPDPTNWRDERVGWGLVLPDRPGKDAAALRTADDAPEPIRGLVEERGGKVLRYGNPAQYKDWTLRDYAGGDLLGAASAVGMGSKQLPMYLLLYGPPSELPWELQFSLNPVRHVGRVDLTGDALSNYVGALLAGWKDSQARYQAPVVWSVDHGGGDITTLMRKTIAAPMYGRLTADADMPDARYVDGSEEPATGSALGAALAERRPALVITTSHGSTGPLGEAEALRARLGLLVDSDRRAVSPDELLNTWQPDGAIWFAQACCSAGATQPSAYSGLFDPGSILARTLDGVAAAGTTTAPMPRALLGASKPLRAFIGRVEPTFDWSMSFPPNRQMLTDDLIRSLYDRLCTGNPVGLAMEPTFHPIASLLITREQAIRKYNETAGQAARSALDMVLYSKVTAQDRAATVILGDPTVAIPLPAPSGGC